MTTAIIIKVISWVNPIAVSIESIEKTKSIITICHIIA